MGVADTVTEEAPVNEPGLKEVVEALVRIRSELDDIGCLFLMLVVSVSLGVLVLKGCL